MTVATKTFEIPRELNENRRYRIQLLQDAETDVLLQSALREKCSRDLLFWVDTFAWTKDPRRVPDVLPFVSYAFQGPTMLKIEKAINIGKDLLTEKSRDMGASWMVLYVMLHKWMFEDGSDFRLGSRKEDFVDIPGDIDTLFEKLRFCLEKQPLWLMPEGFDWRKHSTYMRLINPENGNAFIGESANPNFATGGRRKAILMDEFAKWDRKVADAAWTSTADVSPCRFPVSTPVGSGNKFALLAKGTQEKIEKLTLHWTLHPTKANGAYYLDGARKIPIKKGKAFEMWLKLRGKPSPPGVKGGLVRSPWYDKECERRKPADIAQELDCDYLASGSPFFDLYQLEQQRVWKEYVPDTPSWTLPYGMHVRGRLVKRMMKTEFMIQPLHGWLKMYEKPKPGYEYIVAVDTAEGLVKGDESAVIVREKITRNVVAVCNGIYAPEEIAEMAFKMECFYNEALNLPENNNHGYTTCKQLFDLGSNLYFTIRDEVKGSSEGKSTPKRGFTTTLKTRPLMLDAIEEEIRNSVFEMRDYDLITESQTFIRNETSGKPEADGEYLDDLVIACAICGYGITRHPYKPKKTKQKAQQKQAVHDSTKKRKNAGFRYKRKQRA